MRQPDFHAGGFPGRVASNAGFDPVVADVRYRPDVQRPEIALHAAQFDSIAVRHPPARNYPEEIQRIRILHIKHPAGFHQEVGFFVGLVGTQFVEMLPERIGSRIGVGGHGVVIGA